MNDHMKLTEILMDELPEEHPWKGNIRGLVERLIANGVTFAKDTDVLTNADRIRAMSDGELAESLSKTVVDAICYSHSAEKQVDKIPKEIWDDLVKEYLEWLKQPAEE